MNEQKLTITFIVNPISGTRKKDSIPDLIGSVLDTNKFDSEIVFTEYAGHAAEIARTCVEHHVDVCVAVGGDGTVNEVARSLVHTPTALGIIPCGSGHGLARHLCLPMDARNAVEIINKAVIESFDYGLINDMPFFCTCGMGFDAFISLKFAEAGKRGPITYVENVLKEGLKYKPETYIIEDESGTQRHKAFLIACANAAQYGNNAYIAPGASMKDGMMDVIIMEPFDALDAPTIAYDLFSKTLTQNSKIKTFRAKKIHVHRSAPGAIHFDGDPMITGTDIDIEMQPLGLRSIVNPMVIEDAAHPNPMLNAFSDFFNNINNVREDIVRSGRRIHVINKLMLRRLSRL
jgi:YegS/Rv2252/BmrU family lipid kinase